jgi:diaminopimelate epimerase
MTDAKLHYSIFDPTGNITALVESPVDVPSQPAAAADIMRRRPDVEQVGFLTLPASPEDLPALRMAGGEFCGNASMCAAALTLLRRPPESDGEAALLLRVSGASQPVEVRLRAEGPRCWSAAVRMPPAQGIEETDFRFDDLHGTLPLVRMEGISHLIVEPGSPFFTLIADRPAAERAVREWARALAVPGLGLMFLDDACGLTPLVHIPASDTIFWENSCASGSAAVGMVLAARAGAPVSLALDEPGGTLRVECTPASAPLLYGTVRQIE